MKHTNKKFKIFLKTYVTCLMLFIIPVTILYIFLYRAGEHNTYKDIVNAQLKQKSIYGTSLNQATFSYKMELIKKIKPEIIAMGSSTILPFRREFFNGTFINAGGAVNNLLEAVVL